LYTAVVDIKRIKIVFTTWTSILQVGFANQPLRAAKENYYTIAVHS